MYVQINHKKNMFKTNFVLLEYNMNKSKQYVLTCVRLLFILIWFFVCKV
jgi:hypothetical protein